jgi:hypothetical protein
MEHANVVAPHLPSTTKYRSEATTIQGCTEADINEVSGSLPTYPLAAVQTMPTQEMGTIKRLP